MNILSKALDHIKMTIPMEVLRVAFRDDLNNWRQVPTSLDSHILEKVIKARVTIDANLVGGSMVIIPLDGVPMKFIDNFTYIYEIPPEKTNHREIVSVLSVGYMPFNSSFGFGGFAQSSANINGMNDLSSAGQRVMDAASNIPVVSTATCDLIGYNTVLIRDPMTMSATYTLRCVIANEVNFNNINPRSYLYFANLCQLAVKSYIYNKMIIAIDQAYLSGGMELGSFKQYIESLADSEQMYQTYLTETWSGVSYMNDRPSHERFLRLQISPGL